MAKDIFRQVSRDDPRLKTPHVAVFVIPTEFGPIVPVIKRRKYFKDKKGNPIPDGNNKATFEQWFDLPGGKPDPIYDTASLISETERILKLKKKHPKSNMRPEDGAKIIGIEDPALCAARETWEETGLRIEARHVLGQSPHPAKPGLMRVFHAAAMKGGEFDNLVPTEHDYVIPTDPENAIALLGERIPQEVRDFIRSEAKRIDNRIDCINRQSRNGNVIDIDLYRDQNFSKVMRAYGYPSLIAPMAA